MPDELRPKIRKQVFDAAREQVAAELIRNWKSLRFALDEGTKGKTGNDRILLSETPPTLEALMGKDGNPGIVDTLIEGRWARLPLEGDTSRQLTLDEIDRILENTPSVQPFIASIGKLQKKVPRKETLEEITDAIVAGIEKKNTWWDKAMGFLGGLVSWLVAVVSSLFTGESAPGFWESVAGSSSPGMGDSVKGELHALAQKNQDAALILRRQDGKGNSMIDLIGNMTEAGVYRELGVAPPADKATPSLDLSTVKPVDINIGELRTVITNQILYPAVNEKGEPDMSKSLSADIAKKFAASVEAYKADGNKSVELRGFSIPFTNNSIVKGWLAPDEKAIKKSADNMSTIIAATVADRITNPQYRDQITVMTKNQLADFLADEVEKELLAKEKSLNLPTGVNLTDRGKDNPHLKEITGEVRKKAAEKYDTLKPILDLMKNNTTTIGKNNIVPPVRVGMLPNIRLDGHIDRDTLGTYQPSATENLGNAREIV